MSWAESVPTILCEGDISMDLTSHKERHIIKCLGLAHREEKCGMSPADREEDLMLFIREHLPETAFSPFALDTAPPPLQSAHRRADTGRKRSLLGVLPPMLCSQSPPSPWHPGRGFQAASPRHLLPLSLRCSPPRCSPPRFSAPDWLCRSESPRPSCTLHTSMYPASAPSSFQS